MSRKWAAPVQAPAEPPSPPLPGFAVDERIADPPPAQRHSPTSMAAARAVQPRAGQQRALVLDVIRRCGPLSDAAIARIAELPENSARPRRVELARVGWICQVGIGVTASGNHCVLWGIAVNDDGGAAA